MRRRVPGGAPGRWPGNAGVGRVGIPPGKIHGVGRVFRSRPLPVADEQRFARPHPLLAPFSGWPSSFASIFCPTTASALGYRPVGINPANRLGTVLAPLCRLRHRAPGLPSRTTATASARARATYSVAPSLLNASPSGLTPGSSLSVNRTSIRSTSLSVSGINHRHAVRVGVRHEQPRPPCRIQQHRLLGWLPVGMNVGGAACREPAGPSSGDTICHRRRVPERDVHLRHVHRTPAPDTRLANGYAVGINVLVRRDGANPRQTITSLPRVAMGDRSPSCRRGCPPRTRTPRPPSPTPSGYTAARPAIVSLARRPMSPVSERSVDGALTLVFGPGDPGETGSFAPGVNRNRHTLFSNPPDTYRSAAPLRVRFRRTPPRPAALCGEGK